MSIEPNEFREALSRFASGVTVLTCRDIEGKLHGITVSAFCSVSLEPPLVLSCIDRSAGTHDALHQDMAYVVNVLKATQQPLSDRFASPVADRFTGVDIRMSENEIPILEGSLAALECRLRYSYDGGDHTIFVGEVERTHLSDGSALLYHRGGYRVLEDLP